MIHELKEKVFKNAIVFKLSAGNKPSGRDFPEIENARVFTAYSELFAQAKKLSDEGHVVIFDRAYPSQMVYCVKRQKHSGWSDQLTEPAWAAFDKYIALQGVKMIYCWAPDAVVAERFKTDGEDYMRVDEIEALKARYMIFVERSAVKTLMLNSTDEMSENVEAVKNFISH